MKNAVEISRKRADHVEERISEFENKNLEIIQV